MPKLLRYIALILVVPITVSISLYYYRLNRFYQSIGTAFIRQELSFPYYFKPGKSEFRLILGDMNGLNFQGYTDTLKMPNQEYPDKDSIIVVPSILPYNIDVGLKEISNEDFYLQVANNRSVVIADNFCTSDWGANKDRDIYSHSQLSPGVFCFSESQSRNLDSIIRNFSVKNITILYDTESYRDFIVNFLKYLTEHEINYELVKSVDFKGL